MADVLDLLYADNSSTTNNEFTSFKSGSKFYVKVLGDRDIKPFYSYGIFNLVNSFVPEKQPKRDKYGNPIEDLTPWDLAYKYHKDKSQDWTDKHGQEAGKYRAKLRFAMGFYDLTSGEQIVIDVSRNQAQALHGVIKKFEGRLDKMAFELAKTGKGTSTTVSLTPVMFPDEDLTDEQRANLEKAPEEFDHAKFEGINYEASYDEQVENLIKAGFDISLIGLEAPSKDEEGGEEPNEGSSDDDYDF